MSAYTVAVRDLAPLDLVVVRAQAAPADLGGRIREVLKESAVYRYLAETGVRGGLNIITYREVGPADWEIEIGVVVDRPLAGAGVVVPSKTPGGRCATTRHRGPYEGLKSAHEAIRAWCRGQGYSTTDLSWEIYGHWSENPAGLETDVFYAIGDP